MSKILYFLGGVAAGSVATYLLLREHMERRIEEEVDSVREVYKNGKMQQRASEGLTEASESDSSGIDEAGKEKLAEIAKEIASENAKLKADLLTANAIADSNGYSAKSEKANSKAGTVAYNLFSKPPRAIDIHNGIDEGEDLEIEISEPEERPDISERADKPYVITPSQFADERKEFDKITLLYYTDRVLIEEMSRGIITDINGTVGYDSLHRFGEYEEDVVYVRNEKISTDFEIIQNDVAFADLYDGP